MYAALSVSKLVLSGSTNRKYTIMPELADPFTGILPFYYRCGLVFLVNQRRWLFELHAARQIESQLDLNLCRIEVRKETAKAKFLSSTQYIIQGLGPHGKAFQRPGQYASKLNLSFVDPTAAALDRAKAAEDARSLEQFAEANPAKRSGVLALLAAYLEKLAPFVLANHDGPAFRHGEEADKALMEFIQISQAIDCFGRATTIFDLMDWTWILTGNTADQCVYRFVMIRNVRAKEAVRGVEKSQRPPIPQGIFLLLLQHQRLSARGLRLLLIHAWSLMRHAETSSARKQVQHQPLPPDHDKESLSVDGDSQGPIVRKVLSHSRRDDFGWSEDCFVTLLIRLFRISCRVWPEACASVTALCCRYLDGVNFQKVQGPNKVDPARMSFLYNTMLVMLSSPTSSRPFLAMDYQQRAQFTILRRMQQFEPSLVVDYRGYKAIARVQLLHRKTAREREWAFLKAKTWPPWKSDRSGLDADIQPLHGFSRAKEAMIRAQEAGYAADAWTRVNSVLAGWDTDDSPTIQTRRAVRSEIPSHEGESSLLWVNRIDATRTLDEAWAIYLSMHESGALPDQNVYRAIFEKLEQEEYRVTSRHRLGAGKNSEILPGDGVEREDPSENILHAVYLRERPLSKTEFLRRLIHDGVHPSGNFLASLLKYSSSMCFGVEALLASDLDQRSIRAVFEHHEDNEARARQADDMQILPDHVFHGILAFLSRRSTHIDDSGGDANEEVFELLSEKLPDLATSPFLHTSPVLQAIYLTRLSRPSDSKAWTPIIRALATDHYLLTLRERGESRFARNASIAWHTITQVIEIMQDNGAPLDLEIWQYISAALDNAILEISRYRAHSQFHAIDAKQEEAMMNVLHDGVPLVQGLFQELTQTQDLKDRLPKDLLSIQQQLESDVVAEVEDEAKAEVKNKTKVGVKVSQDNASPPSTPDSDETYETTEWVTNKISTESESHRDILSQGFVPADLLLPRLFHIPKPNQLHGMMRLLGLARDYQGMLELIEWCVVYFAEIKTIVNESPASKTMFRRFLISTRVFLERSWTKLNHDNSSSFSSNTNLRAGNAIGSGGHWYYDIADRSRRVLVESSGDSAPPEIIIAVRSAIEQETGQDWGGWPLDEEVWQYLNAGRFV